MSNRFANQPSSRRQIATLAIVLALPGCVVNAVSAPPMPFEAERRIQRSLEVPPGVTLRIENLAGGFWIEPADGPNVEIEVLVHAAGNEQDEANTLAERIELALEELNETQILRATYPVDDYTEFYYPGAGESHSLFGIFETSNTRLEYMGGRVRVSTRRGGRSASVWADFHVRVPRGTRLQVLNAIGAIDSVSLSGEVSLEVPVGSIKSRNGEGRVELDTGSGSITVEGHRGDVLADTGSGRVVMSEVVGNVVADTGSGIVRLTRVTAESVEVDTGSGGVTLDQVSGSISVRTGSGSVRADGVVSGERVLVSTGSGRVRLNGDVSRARNIERNTSSGRVELRLSDYPAMNLELSTGSGGIDVDLPMLVLDRDERHVVVGRAGGDPVASLVIDTGSGSIRISKGS